MGVDRLGDDGAVADPSRRIQKAAKEPGETALSRFLKVSTDMFKNEGAKAFYKGITPRVLRVAPGQAIVFTVRPCFLLPASREREKACTGDLCHLKQR
jgi:hypothetical protein